MPEKKGPVRKTTPAGKAPAKKAPAKKPAAAKEAAPSTAATRSETCPRCGTPKFGPEQRIRADGNRTVRYSILVCERGHTFAHPLTTSG